MVFTFCHVWVIIGIVWITGGGFGGYWEWAVMIYLGGRSFLLYIMGNGNILLY